MHSDQTRKDGSSESMIQALYYDFVANYVKTRMYSTRYVQGFKLEQKRHSITDLAVRRLNSETQIWHSSRQLRHLARDGQVRLRRWTLPCSPPRSHPNSVYL